MTLIHDLFPDVSLHLPYRVKASEPEWDVTLCEKVKKMDFNNFKSSAITAHKLGSEKSDHVSSIIGESLNQTDRAISTTNLDLLRILTEKKISQDQDSKPPLNDSHDPFNKRKSEQPSKPTKEQLENKTLKLHSLWHPDGSHDGTISSDNGSKPKVSTKIGRDGSVTSTEYAPDGKTPSVKVEQKSDGTCLTTEYKNGLPFQFSGGKC